MSDRSPILNEPKLSDQSFPSPYPSCSAFLAPSPLPVRISFSKHTLQSSACVHVPRRTDWADNVMSISDISTRTRPNGSIKCCSKWCQGIGAVCFRTERSSTPASIVTTGTKVVDFLAHDDLLTVVGPDWSISFDLTFCRLILPTLDCFC